MVAIVGNPVFRNLFLGILKLKINALACRIAFLLPRNIAENSHQSTRLFGRLDAAQSFTSLSITAVQPQRQVVLVACQAVIAARRSGVGLTQQLRDIPSGKAVNHRGRLRPAPGLGREG